jgi:hypothetical protein
LIVGLVAAVLSAGRLQAQPAPAVPTAELEPIRCWWRTSAGSVRVGETFSVVLTCAVIETDDVQVVPDQAALDGAVVPLAPFEVLRTEHPPDLRSGQRRFFQYDYTVQVINPDVIGQDVLLPELVIHYRINSRLPGSSSQQGRDLTYIMPRQQIRVVSMVPQYALDIRDTPDARFAPLDALRRRAGLLEVAAIALMGLGGLMTVLALLGLVRTLRGPKKATDQTMGTASLVGVALGELKAVQSEREQQGWSMPLVSRAAAALRIIAAAALERTISQRVVEPTATTGEGKIVVKRGRKAKTIAVSSSITAEDIERGINRLPPTAPADQRQLLEGLHAELATLSAAQYGEPRPLDQERLDTALASAAAAGQMIRSQHMSPRHYIKRWTGRAPQVEQQHT